MTDKYGWFLRAFDRFGRTPIGGAGEAWYSFWRAPSSERKRYGGYFLIAMGAVTGLLPLGIFGAWLLTTIKPDGVGGFKSSTTYGYPAVTNSTYEGAPRRVVPGKHRINPSYVSACLFPSCSV